MDWPRNIGLAITFLPMGVAGGALAAVSVSEPGLLGLGPPLLGGTVVGVRRCLRACVEVLPEGLIVRRVWSTRRVPADDVRVLETRMMVEWPGQEDADVEELTERMRAVFGFRGPEEGPRAGGPRA